MRYWYIAVWGPALRQLLRLPPLGEEGRGESHHFLAKIFVATGGPPGRFVLGFGEWSKNVTPPYYILDILVLAVAVVKKPCLTTLR